MSRRPSRSLRFTRPLLGFIIAPTAVLAVFEAVRALLSLASRPKIAVPFLVGAAVYCALFCLGLLRLRGVYVLAHELTHAWAAWLGGGKVLRMVVRSDSGRVDLSRSSVFIALAPYWIPLPVLAVVVGYRALLWAGAPPYGREIFLALTGAGLAFHVLHTVESLWTAHQDDLDEAGVVLSVALIALLNGLILVLALGCLFPRGVALGSHLLEIGRGTAGFWGGAAELVLSATRAK
ncbi:MAG: M50 family metallopeptidase [Elusimicrobiota bacterium]